MILQPKHPSKWIGLLVDASCQDYEKTGIKGDERFPEYSWHFDAKFLMRSSTARRVFYDIEYGDKF